MVRVGMETPASLLTSRGRVQQLFARKFVEWEVSIAMRTSHPSIKMVSHEYTFRCTVIER
jgi:hypothetical protein